MHFNNLKHVPLAVIANTFNTAFADYAIPMSFTEEQLKEKILRDGHSLEYSVGAFVQDELVGFILQGVGAWGGKLTAYNGGTGVVPAYRGQKLTQQMYAYSFPQLKIAGVEQCLLEVLQTNKPALKTYEALGFERQRSLISYRGQIKLPPSGANLPVANFTFQTVADLNGLGVQKLWNYFPSWQYNLAALDRIKHLTTFIEILAEDTLIGYGAITKNTNRIAQFAIAPAYRRRGLGTALFQKLTTGITEPVAVINVDAGDEFTIRFLQALGLNTFISQYEMLLPLF